MNVYEEAHQLARAIKESDEFKEFVRLRKEVDSDEQISEMFARLQELQQKVQLNQLLEEEEDPKVEEEIQSLSTMIMSKPKAVEYLDAESRFSVMLNDVYKILNDVMSVVSM